MPYKPAGYTSVAPYLIVDDAEVTLAFVTSVFSAEQLRVTRTADGRIAHAEARINDTVVMVGQMPDGPDAHVHVYTADADAAMARALAAGGVLVEPVTLKDDGDRRGGVRDGNGTTWWLGQQQ